MIDFAILRRMRRHLPVFVLACTAAFSLTGPASAQDDVFVDPDSPTAREYEIPLERARRDASADPSAPRPYRSRSASLFGEGIDRAEAPAAGEASDGSAGSRAGASRGKDAPSRQPSTKPRERLPRAVEAAIRRPAAQGEGRTAQLFGFAGALLVGLGLLGGVMLRRRWRR